MSMDDDNNPQDGDTQSVFCDLSTKQGQDELVQFFSDQLDNLTGQFFSMVAVLAVKDKMDNAITLNANLVASVTSTLAKLLVASEVAGMTHDMATIHKTLDDMMTDHRVVFASAQAEAVRLENDGHLHA